MTKMKTVLSLAEGEKLIKLARQTIELYLKEGRIPELPMDVPPSFLEKKGVFVTLLSYPSYELRGCIGLPYPQKELVRAVIDAALAAAFEDPRFNEVDERELRNIIIEVSILTEPKKIEVKKPEEYLNKIVIGRDGLIIKAGFYSGLLLPQVPVEQGWNEEEYLANLCYKAGLSSSAWQEEDIEIYSFQAQIFSEEKPYGNVIEKKLKAYEG